MNKKILIIIAVGILILMGLFSYFYQEDKDIILEKEPNLTAEERQIYEDKLKDSAQRLSQAKDDNERYDLYLYQGYQYYGLGKFGLAKKSYEKAIELKPDNYNAYVAMYQVMLDMQDNQGARDSIKKAIEYGTTVADNWLKYIILEKERFNASDARINDLYIEALVKTNNHVNLLTSYAQHLEKMGNLQAAKEYWQKAIEANPDKKTIYEAEIKRIEGLLNKQ